MQTSSYSILRVIRCGTSARYGYISALGIRHILPTFSFEELRQIFKLDLQLQKAKFNTNAHPTQEYYIGHSILPRQCCFADWSKGFCPGGSDWLTVHGSLGRVKQMPQTVLR